ncbi:MAG: metallophosphoesterase [Myxococcales bacterium]
MGAKRAVTEKKQVVRLAAVGDLHCKKDSVGQFAPWLSSVNERADVLLLCGDLTDYGTLEEAEVLARELSAVRVPMLGVLGNHDCESGKADEVARVLKGAGVTMLSGDSVEVMGVGFTGVKGFCGGFGSHTLGHWGEPEIKRFVDYAIEESLKLESGLARLRTEHRVVLLHYAPVRGTIEGEPLEIFPFLGCSRLEEPLLRYPLSAVFHGHAHRGQLEARTSRDQPVYNVAMPLLRRSFADRPPYRVLELATPADSKLPMAGE